MTDATLLVCRPTYFGVEYVINPWMEGNVGLASQPEAQRQWDHLLEVLTGVTRVAVLEAQAGLPDMCFAANAGLLLNHTFVPAVFRMAQRAPEVPHFRAWFERQGYEIATLPDDQAFEGEGDALFHPGQSFLWAGYGVRSSLLSHRTLSQIFDVEVVSLKLVDPRFYHLDTCFLPLPGGAAMYWPAAFDNRSLTEIRRRIPPDQRVEVGERDALGFCCNGVRLGDRVVVSQASPELRTALHRLGYDVLAAPMSEFIKAGGAAKCLCLLLKQDVPAERGLTGRPESPIRTGKIALTGHLLDANVLGRTLERVNQGGGSFRIEHLVAGQRHDLPSTAQVRIAAPDAETLDQILADVKPLGAQLIQEEEAQLQIVDREGVAPEGFYSTTIYPTEVLVGDRWILASRQRMDGVIVVDPDRSTAAVTLLRDLAPGDHVVCGGTGIRILTEERTAGSEAFSFMGAGISPERRVERQVDELAWEMRRLKAHGRKTVVVAGAVVIHTGGGLHLEALIKRGYVDGLLTGNAVAVHDMELNVFGTSLGVDLHTGTGVRHGHQHHLRILNRVRRAGSVEAAVREGVVTGGVMHACVQHEVPFILAGSIRDDGPLPDTIMDLIEAQRAYAEVIEGADMILMLGSMLHSIGVSNMTPAGVRLVCVDISPAAITKLADRGAMESTGIVTDVGLFLNLLDSRLRDD